LLTYLLMYSVSYVRGKGKTRRVAACDLQTCYVIHWRHSVKETKQFKKLGILPLGANQVRVTGFKDSPPRYCYAPVFTDAAQTYEQASHGL